MNTIKITLEFTEVSDYIFNKIKELGINLSEPTTFKVNNDTEEDFLSTILSRMNASQIFNSLVKGNSAQLENALSLFKKKFLEMRQEQLLKEKQKREN